MHNNEAVEFAHIWSDMTDEDYHICNRSSMVRCMVKDSICEGWELLNMLSNMFHPMCPYQDWRQYVIWQVSHICSSKT